MGDARDASARRRYPSRMLLLLACATSPGGGASPAAGEGADTAAGLDSADTAEPTESGADSGDTAPGDSSSEDSAAADTADTADSGAAPSAGPCDAYANAVAMGDVDDPNLDELSGLAVSRQNPGILWTHEDSGGAAELYALDFTGATVATIHVDGVENHDWEDLAIGPCGSGWCLVIGEIGTSNYDHSLLVVEEPLLTGATEWTLSPAVQPFTFPGDPEDAEGLALFPDGTPLLVSKRDDATAGLYTLPAGASGLVWQADIATGVSGESLTAMATAADLSTDGATLLLRTYLHLYSVDVADVTAPGTPNSLAFAIELQGEAVAWDPNQGGFWQVGEGAGRTLYYTGCATE